MVGSSVDGGDRLVVDDMTSYFTFVPSIILTNICLLLIITLCSTLLTDVAKVLLPIIPLLLKSA